MTHILRVVYQSTANMGGKHSKQKTSTDREDPMNDPSYLSQGEPDAYINETPGEDDVWVRADSDITCKTFDDCNFHYDSGQSKCRNTALRGPGKNSFPLDHYDIINDSDSETELKYLEPCQKSIAQPKLSHRLPLQSTRTNRLTCHPDYEYMVKVFQPLLVANLIVRRLLPHLPFLTNQERIRAIEDRDPRAAVIYLIDELCSNSNTEPGRWKQFIQALERCGYKYIVETLRGQDPVDHTYQKEYLKIITPVLREIIFPSELVLVLWGVDVISNEDKEEIGQLERNLGPLAATDRLLDLVPRRHKQWYTHLVNALRDVGSTEAADMLAIPEVLNFDGEDNVDRKKRTSKDNKCKGMSLARAKIFESLAYIEYVDAEDQTEIKRDNCPVFVPDNCEYLDCENSSDTETENLDDLYLSMRKPDHSLLYESFEGIERDSKTTTKGSQTKDMCIKEFMESKDDISLIDKASSSNQFLVNNQNDYEHGLKITRRSSTTAIIMKKDSADKTADLEANDRYVYGYEFPIQASVPQETPEDHNDEERNRSQNEIGNGNFTVDDTTETNSVEVIALSVPASTNGGFSKHSVKGINRPPKPSPRSQTVMALPIPSREKHRYNSLGKDEGIKKPPKPTPRKQTKEDKAISQNKNDIDKSSVRKINHYVNPYDVEEEEEFNKGDNDTDTKEFLSKKTTRELNSVRSDILESLEEDTHPPLRIGRKPLCHAKVQASILKRKNKRKKIQSFKLNGTRRSKNVLPSRMQGAKCLNLEKGRALINRVRMPTPKADRKRNLQEEERCKSLPNELEKQKGQVPITMGDVEHVSGSNKDPKNTQLPCYSEPFRCHRRKEDEDIFTTVGQVFTNRKSGNIPQFADTTDFFKLHPHSKAHCHSNRKRMSDIDELLGILGSCKAEEYSLKSDIEIESVSKDDLNPELRTDLEELRDMAIKLNNLIHGEKVLKKRLQLQEDVNEVLKQHRHLSSKLSVKKKEAEALEAAIAGEKSNCIEDSFVPYSSEEECKMADLPRIEFPVLGRKQVSENVEYVPVDAPNSTGNNLTEVGVVKRKFDDSDKDSAFYSEFTTKL